MHFSATFSLVLCMLGRHCSGGGGYSYQTSLPAVLTWPETEKLMHINKLNEALEKRNKVNLRNVVPPQILNPLSCVVAREEDVDKSQQNPADSHRTAARCT